MFCKKEFVQTALLSRETDTVIKFTEDLEFTIPKFDNGNGWYQIKNVKGDFEITRFERIYNDGHKSSASYDRTNNKLYYMLTNNLNLTFYITVITEMEEMCVVNYQLSVPSTRLQFLKWGTFIKSEFVLPGHDDLKLTYYVKKIKETHGDDIEICIENPYDVEIQGKQGDFKSVQSSSKDVDLLLSFGFYPSILTSNPVVEKNDEEDASNDGNEHELSVEQQDESTQPSAANESRPESVIQSELSNVASRLYKIGSNNLFADVFFITADGTKIPSHRNILAEFSDIFLQIFKDSTELPVQINVDDFDADTIQCALNFICEKPDSINGIEVKVFQFAAKFGIQNLIDACCTFFEASVDPSNVCEYIQIAYSHNFEGLKQKCLKVLVQKKDEIDSANIADFPKNILFDAFYFKL